MTKQNKRTAIWISKESREIIEKYAKDNMLGLGEAIDSILIERDKGYKMLYEAVQALTEAYKELKALIEKPWWKIW